MPPNRYIIVTINLKEYRTKFSDIDIIPELFLLISRVHFVRRPLICLLYQLRITEEYGSFRGVRIGGGNRNTHATFLNTNLTWLDLELNPGRRGEKPATNNLIYGIAIAVFTWMNWEISRNSARIVAFPADIRTDGLPNTSKTFPQNTAPRLPTAHETRRGETSDTSLYLHLTSRLKGLLSVSPSELLARQVYRPEMFLLTDCSTSVWLLRITPVLALLCIGWPCTHTSKHVQKPNIDM